MGDAGTALLCCCLLLPWGKSASGSGQSRNDCITFAEHSEGFGWKTICGLLAAALGKLEESSDS